MKVQFVAQGLEEHRILAGIALATADRVVIIRNSNRKLSALEARVDSSIQSVVNTVREGKVSYFFVQKIEHDGTKYKFDFFDLVDALRNLEKWFAEEASHGNQLSVNLSSGPSLATIALFCAGMRFGADALYVTPEYYEAELIKGSSDPEHVAKGIKSGVTLPRMPVNYLYSIPFDILRALNQGDGSVDSISEIVPLIRPEIQRMELVKKKRVYRSEQARIAKLLETLRSLGYVEVEPYGRKKKIHITSLGRTILAYKE